MIRALLFDCNGIIADDEPIHLRLFQKVLKEEGISLSRKDYFEKYLAMDDRSCFREVLKERCRPVSREIVQELIRRKASYYRETIQTELVIFSGVKSFVERHEEHYGMAIVSGALRDEILRILEHAGIRSYFPVVVSTEDVRNGKPAPDAYLKGLRKLNRLKVYRKEPLKTDECLAIEDSIHGIEAAHRAGMKCMAVTNSYSAKELSRADVVVQSLERIEVSRLLMS